MSGDSECRSGIENTSPEDVDQSEFDAFIYSKTQDHPPDGSPEVSNQNRGPHTHLASGVWGLGVANCKLLKHCSTGNYRICGLTAPVKEPAGDTAESSPPHSSDRSNQPSILSFSSSDSTCALSTGMDLGARQVLDSVGTVSHETLPDKDEPIHLPQGQFLEKPAPRIKGREKSSEPEDKNGRSPDSANELDTPTKSRGGSQHGSLTGADATSLHAESTNHKPTSHLETEDSLLRQRDTPSHTEHTGHKTTSHLSGTPSLCLPEHRRNLNTPPDPSPVSRSNELYSTKATSYVSNPRSSMPSTPTNSHKSRHSKTLSAEAASFHPSPRSNSSPGTMQSCSNDGNRSTSTVSGHLIPSYIPSMPKTPLKQRRHRHWREASTGTPSLPVRPPRVWMNYGTPPPYEMTNHHYPRPQHHTPKGEGQVFGIQGSIPPPSQAHIPYTFGPIMPPPIMPPPLPSPMHSFDNTIHQNAQIYKQGEQNPEYSQPSHFDSYATSQAANAPPNAPDLHQNGNMYTQDTNGYGARYFSNHTDPARQVHSYPHYIDHARLKET